MKLSLDYKYRFGGDFKLLFLGYDAEFVINCFNFLVLIKLKIIDIRIEETSVNIKIKMNKEPELENLYNDYYKLYKQDFQKLKESFLNNLLNKNEFCPEFSH